MIRTTRIAVPFQALFLALFAVGGGLATNQPKASPSAEAQLSQEQYDFLQLCAQFPALTACQASIAIPATIEKRKSAYMRFGRAAPEPMEADDATLGQAMEKRKSAYMRFGKRSPMVASDEMDVPAMEKRKSAYMRFGKRKSAYMRFGKRSSGDEMPEMEKRKSAYMRFGKRSMTADEMPVEMEKRKSAYMRFGKRR